MNNSTTRKIVLGLLTVLVLAFSVQGIADALTFSTSRSGDLETKAPNEQFTIRFSVSLKGNTAIKNSDGDLTTESAALIDSSGYRIDSDGNRLNAIVAGDGSTSVGTIPINSSGFKLDSNRNRVTTHIDKNSDGDVDSGETFYTIVDESGTEDTVDSSGYSVDSNGDRETPLNKPTPAKQFKVSDAVRYHYTSEAIGIDFAGPARIIRVGSRDVNIAADTGTTPDGTANLAMYERSHANYNGAAEHQKLSGSVTLVLEPTGVDGGVVTVKVTDDTPTIDAPTNGKSSPITFTLYVVKYQSNISDANSVTTLVGDGVDYAFDNDVRPLGSYFTFVADSQVPVHYSVDGSGTLAIRQAYTDGSPASMKTASKTLSASSGTPVFIDMKRGTNKVTALVSGGTPRTMIFMYQGITPSKYPNIEITGVNNQIGATGGRLEEPLVVKVTDGNNRPLAGLAVAFTSTPTGGMFIPVPETRVYTDITDVDLVDNTEDTTIATSSRPAPNAELWVQTDSSGVAEVYYQLSSTEGNHTITATVQGQASLTETFNAVADDDARRASLQMVSMEKATGTGKEGIYYLSVIARSVGGHRIPNVIIEFEALSGSLRPRNTDQPTEGTGAGQLPAGTTIATSGNEIFVITGSDGEAEVEYNVGPTDSTKIVTAEVHDEQGTALEYDFILDRVTFDVQRATSRAPDTTTDTAPDTAPDTATLTVTPTTITGPPGSTRDITITASGAAQIGNLVNFAVAGGSASPGSGLGTFTSTLTLPSQEGTYTLDVTSGTQSVPVTVTVSSAAAPDAPTGGRIALEVPLSGAPNSSQSIRVTVLDENGSRVPDVDVTLSITSGGGTFSASNVKTGPAGTATSTLTLGSAPGSNYFVTAAAANYPRVEKRISITGTAPPPAVDTSVPRAAGEAAAIDVYDGDGQRGILNVRLSEPLVVEVTDANGNSVSAERVTFRTTIGSGRFSPARPRTNGNGRAQTSFTPTSSGTIRIAASVEGVSARAVFRVTTGDPPAAVIKVSGDAQSGTPGRALANAFVVAVQDANGGTIEGIPVTFSVTAGGGRLSETTATTDEDGRAETTLTLGRQAGINSVEASVSGVDPVMFNTSIEPEIRIAAANRPLMYWIDGGMLYRLAGAKATKIADNVNGVAVGGEKLYYIEQTSERSGVIHAANLDGDPNAEVVKTLTSVPKGLAIDTANAKLYLTNGWGKIQRLNVDGTQFETNFVAGLTDPMHIAVANGHVYWTEGTDAGRRVRTMNLNGTKNIRNLATGAGALGGLAVDARNLYWTEQTSMNRGRIRSVNLDGTGAVTDVFTLTAVPMGITVDSADNRLYWTNGWGKVQRRSGGSGYHDVVTGIMNPTAIAIGGPNVQIADETPKTSTPTTANRSKYDINGDGSVDNTDTGLIVLAISTGDTSAKYDVNGDGKVNFSDYLLVSENADAGAAGAPSVFGMKMNARQIQRLQEQVDLLIASGDRSPVAMRALIYFQQLIATARPEKTQLLANYPNPFNPETWIPYELATDTDVRITIYNAQGVVIRTLQLGQQAAGYYTDRERAAYWDGRNAFGEQVASGVYFYQLETDTMSALRKMVILK